MRKVGNVASNKNYNPQSKKPQMPVDTDEADGAMERFIRQKYMNRTFGSTKRHNTGSTESDETPPPLPPKTPSRFGFRSASSIFPLGSKAKSQLQQPAPSPLDPAPQPSQRWNKASHVFGASVQESDGQDTEKKLAKLRDMGFTDDQRNAMVLKGVSGNLEKTVEALIRLGEGEGRAQPVFAPREQSLSSSRSLTPATSTSGRARPMSPANNNPFDMLDTPPPPQPLSSQSTGTLQNRNPYLSTAQNPFGVPLQQAPAGLDMAFQNMSLAPPSQPLFPNHTGGLAGVPAAPQALYQQPMTPPATSTAQGYSLMGPYSHTQTYPLPAQQPAASYNPFMDQQPVPQQPLAVNTTGMPGTFGNNPFTRSPTRIQSPPLTQIPEQSQQNFYSPAVQSIIQPVGQPSPQLNNPFYAQTMAMPGLPQQPQQQQYPVQMPQQQQFGYTSQLPGQQYSQAAYQPQRPDKASIMALYDYPQLAPTAFPMQDASQVAPQQEAAVVATGPAPGSNNPFMGAGSAAGFAAQPSLVDISAPKQYNTSRESVMALGLEWTNGRHSPDAFASLSARDTR
jgi:hypothetical protein